ncbi:FUSC family protein [Desulfurispora thermophila]|uniref:FUSC family protein n=1 Tax=Desulfurispora thermophila TaxID=265470 RepID=UPI00035C94B1|nr:aromatic acid exporter family protein [Desulfurispora thermophila]
MYKTLATPNNIYLLKTGLAITGVLVLCRLFHLEPALFAAISALLNIQPSIYRSFKNAREQVLSHFLAAAVAIACGYTLGNSPPVIGLVAMLTAGLCQRLQIAGSMAIGVVGGIFILSSPQHDFIHHALTRSYVIFAGLACAMAINALIPAGNHLKTLEEQLEKLNKNVARFFCAAINDFIHLSRPANAEQIKQNQALESQIKSARNLLALCRETGGRQMDGINSRLYYLEKYLDYNSTLLQKANQIYIALEQRLRWRVAQDHPPLSTEYKQMLKVLAHALHTFRELNHQLAQQLFHNKPFTPPPVSEDLWLELSLLIDQWHTHKSGSDFVHALLHFATVANDLKWACRSIKEFYKQPRTSTWQLSVTGGESNVFQRPCYRHSAHSGGRCPA